MGILPFRKKTERRQVWYVSYGSNMSSDRFLCYVQGGRAPGAGMAEVGCEDPTPPAASEPLRLDRRIYFAAHSKRWEGGGVALLDHAEAPPGEGALARGWLISEGQLNDVVAQENGPSGLATDDLDMARVLSEGTVSLGPGRYQTMVYLGDHKGHPMVTFTAPWTLDEVESGDAPVALNGPSAGYRDMIAQGLEETHGLQRDDALDYLDDQPGAFEYEETPDDFWAVHEPASQLALSSYRQDRPAVSDGTVKAHPRRLASGRTTMVRRHRRSGR